MLDLGGAKGMQQTLGGYMWEAAAVAGARVHAAPWGSRDDPCEMDDASVSYDKWAYEVRESFRAQEFPPNFRNVVHVLSLLECLLLSSSRFSPIAQSHKL